MRGVASPSGTARRFGCPASSGLDPIDIDLDAQPVPPGTVDDALQRRHVAVVAPLGGDDVLPVGALAVGRVEVEPAGLGVVHREPGVGGVRAAQLLLPRRRQGLQVAADVARRDARAPEGGDGEMGEVLADAAARLEHRLDGRDEARELRVVLERLVDVTHQRLGVLEHPAPLGGALGEERPDRGVVRDVGRGQQAVVRHEGRFALAPVAVGGAALAQAREVRPRVEGGWQRGELVAGVDDRAHRHAADGVRDVQAEAGDLVAVVIGGAVHGLGLGRDLHPARQAALVRVASRQQAQSVDRLADRPRVLVARRVANRQAHAAPLTTRTPRRSRRPECRGGE